MGAEQPRSPVAVETETGARLLPIFEELNLVAVDEYEAHRQGGSLTKPCPTCSARIGFSCTIPVTHDEYGFECDEVKRQQVLEFHHARVASSTAQEGEGRG